MSLCGCKHATDTTDYDWLKFIPPAPNEILGTPLNRDPVSDLHCSEFPSVL